MSTRDTGRNRHSAFESWSRYDLVLAVIPMTFLLALLVADAFAVTPQIALAGGSLLAALAVADALFLNPPGDT